MQADWHWPPTEVGRWAMRMLGRLEVASVNGSLPKLRSRQCYGLLSYLCLYPGREFSRFELEEAFWPDSDGDRQAQNLRKCLSDLRQILENESGRGSILLTRREHAAISAEKVRTDVEAFRRLVKRAGQCSQMERTQLLTEAFDLYGGQLLPTMPQSWTVPVRMELEEQYANVVVSLIEHLIADGRPGEAVQIGRKAVVVAPLREDVHVALIGAYGAAGLASQAFRQYEELERLLDDNWGETPSAAAQEALEALPRTDPKDVDRTRAAVGQVSRQGSQVVVAYAHSQCDDERLALDIQENLVLRGLSAFVGANLQSGASRAKTVESYIRQAEAVVAIISQRSAASESLLAELELARDVESNSGRPRIVVVRRGDGWSIEGPIGVISQGRHTLTWRAPDDTEEIVEGIVNALAEPSTAPSPSAWLESSGGAVPLESRFYIDREADRDLEQALIRRDGLMLVRGPRQIGKTSLLAKALSKAKEAGFGVALNDFQVLNASHLAEPVSLYKWLAHRFVKSLNSKLDPGKAWNELMSPNASFEDIVEEALRETDGPVLWAMDEVDRLFGHAHANDFFGLLRGWYNRRSLDPRGPWARLTIALTYATEARLFITDINQSPFNVGTRLELRDFDVRQLDELNQRYGSPLKSPEDLEQLHDLTGGQPFLSRQAFDWLVLNNGSIDALEEAATSDQGPFADHLRRLAFVLGQDVSLGREVRRMLDGQSFENAETASRLKAGGVLRQTDSKDLRFRSTLYRSYLSDHLPASRAANSKRAPSRR